MTMFPFYQNPNNALDQLGDIERGFLEGANPQAFDLADLLDTRSFVAIQGLANFWNAHPDSDFGQHMVDLVIAAHSQHRQYLTSVLAGTPQTVSLFISLGDPAMTRALLEGAFPNINLSPRPVNDLSSRLNSHFVMKGVITGIPSRKSSLNGNGAERSETSIANKSEVHASAPETQGVSQFERVIRGMYGATWAYVVQAYPRPRATVITERLSLIDALTIVTSQTKVQQQFTTQQSEQTRSTRTGSTTEMLSGEHVNYRAQYLKQLLERQLERWNRATAAGQWTVDIYFGAGKLEDAQRLAALLVGTLAGPDSRPDPLRAFICRSQVEPGNDLDQFNTPLSSDEVATLIQFPREEVPGYAITDFVRFDVDFHHLPQASLPLGRIQHNGRSMDFYRIALDDLAKHAVVVGVTGSGKTTTLLSLLDYAITERKPFLVIEPAKTEYRALRTVLSGRSDVRVYTLGNENVAPFRFNPFEFEIQSGDVDVPISGPILSHIDFLKAVFNAAFILYAPMPYILETALYEVYEDKGWDLVTGRNKRLTVWKDRHLYPIFPTLTDLYRKIDVIVTRFGYSGEVEQNVRAGLEARIGALRLGSKGLMLDTARGIPLQQLLSFPTILELENIGNDDEKTFIMGLLLARLYEFRRVQASAGICPGGLQHLLVFEEAHRLLKDTKTTVDTESANPRAQAIETFTNMLSEVRGYGQGVIIAEQIPGKLAPDVLKNTNLKIVHRLVARDDRESVGQTMNLNSDGSPWHAHSRHGCCICRGSGSCLPCPDGEL